MASSVSNVLHGSTGCNNGLPLQMPPSREGLGPQQPGAALHHALHDWQKQAPHQSQARQSLSEKMLRVQTKQAKKAVKLSAKSPAYLCHSNLQFCLHATQNKDTIILSVTQLNADLAGPIPCNALHIVGPGGAWDWGARFRAQQCCLVRLCKPHHIL